MFVNFGQALDIVKSSPVWCTVWSNIPRHDCPSPVYPSLQVQLKEPSVLVQFAFTSQAWLLFRHSSISISTKDIEYFMQSLSVWYLRTSSQYRKSSEWTQQTSKIFDIKQRLFTYRTDRHNFLGLSYSLHVLKESKFLFSDNKLLNRLKSMVYKSILKDLNHTNFPSR